MFLHMSAILFTGRGCLPDTPLADRHFPGKKTPQQTATADCSGRYASYWNASFFHSVASWMGFTHGHSYRFIVVGVHIVHENIRWQHTVPRQFHIPLMCALNTHAHTESHTMCTLESRLVRAAAVGSRIPHSRGSQPSGGGGATYNFAKFSKKTAWNWELFGQLGRGAPGFQDWNRWDEHYRIYIIFAKSVSKKSNGNLGSYFLLSKKHFYLCKIPLPYHSRVSRGGSRGCRGSPLFFIFMQFLGKKNWTNSPFRFENPWISSYISISSGGSRIPRGGGGNLPGGGTNLWFCQNFPKNFMNLRIFWAVGAGGARRERPPYIRRWFRIEFTHLKEKNLAGWMKSTHVHSFNSGGSKGIAPGALPPYGSKLS